jgi:sugar phosphate isomerase/epimerase
MKINQVAAQLYTVRDFAKTVPEIAKTLKKIRAIGYEAVQISGLGPISESELVAMLKGEGLTCCATHEDSNTILNDPQQVVDHLQKLGCNLTAYAWPGGIKFDTLPEVKSFAARLNAAGKVLHTAGQVLCYHNHQIEFRRLAGKPILEILFEETDPRKPTRVICKASQTLTGSKTAAATPSRGAIDSRGDCRSCT